MSCPPSYVHVLHGARLKLLTCMLIFLHLLFVPSIVRMHAVIMVKECSMFDEKLFLSVIQPIYLLGYLNFSTSPMLGQVAMYASLVTMYCWFSC